MWTALRLLITSTGLVFVLWSISWSDRVVLPAGTELPDGRRLLEASAFPVVGGSIGPDGCGELTVLIDGGEKPLLELQVDARRLDSDGGDLELDPGLLTTLRHVRADLIALGFLLVGLTLPIRLLRWWLLVRARGLNAAPARLFRLTMVGNFFNFSMPGTHGGDLVKILYVSKSSERPTDAVMTVIADRVAGLCGLLLLGAVAGLFVLEQRAGQLAAASIWSAGLTLTALGLVAFSRAGRRWLEGIRLPARLPWRDKLEGVVGAALAYRKHKGAFLAAVLLSVAVHAAIVLSTTLAGYALGMRAPLGPAQK